MGNRSFVLHFANTTYIACANFSYIGEAGNPSNTTVYGNGTSMTGGSMSAVTSVNNVTTNTMPTAKSPSTGAMALPGTTHANGGEGVMGSTLRRWALPLPLLLSLLVWVL